MVNLDENVIWTGPGLYTVIWTDWLTKTNRENINVKYNIFAYSSDVLMLNKIKANRQM